MNSKRMRFLCLFVCLVLTGCAVRKYQPAPVVPTETASKMESRNLADPGLQSFVEKSLGHPVTPWPPKAWDLGTLSLAALYFNPSFEAARARLTETEAAVVTAGARPNPTLNFSPGVPSPYLLTLDLAVPIETAGKRGHRVQVARGLNQAAQFDLADTAWKLRSGVRLALLDYLLITQSSDLLHSEEQIRSQQVTLLEQRFAVGEIPRPDFDLTRIELTKTHLIISTAEGQVGQAKAVLAASIGIPEAALEGMDFAWTGFEAPPSIESLSAHEIQRDAVLNRLDIRKSLAEYAAAEARVQLEIAKQYPDIQIGPGYTYEERNSFFTIGFSTTLPIFNRNQGPIAEAEAFRQEAAAVFRQKQAQVIAESERALAAYAAALREFAEASDSLRKLQQQQEQMANRAVLVGEEDRLTLYGIRLESSVLARGRLDALGRAQTALGQLEDAVQRPLDPGDIAPMPLNLLPPTNRSSPDAPVKEPTR